MTFHASVVMVHWWIDWVFYMYYSHICSTVWQCLLLQLNTPDQTAINDPSAYRIYLLHICTLVVPYTILVKRFFYYTFGSANLHNSQIAIYFVRR